MFVFICIYIMHNVHACWIKIYLFIYLWTCIMQLTQVCCICYYLVSSSDIVVEIHSAAAKHVEAIYILSERNIARVGTWEGVGILQAERGFSVTLINSPNRACCELTAENLAKNQDEMKDLLREALYFCRLALCEHIAETLRSCIQRCRCHSETRALSDLI